MALRVECVSDLSLIVPPVVDFLSDIDGVDLFERQVLIVPTAGVRAWLAPHLAARLGASRAPSLEPASLRSSAPSGDGVVANVRIGYVGLINGLLRGVEDDDDPWSLDYLTSAVLRALRRYPDDHWLIDKHGGHLRAARAVADRFDRYAARRPHMIRRWESMYESSLPGDPADEDFAWQFDLWCDVRALIGEAPWPCRITELVERIRRRDIGVDLPRRVMVAGLETVSAATLEMLTTLSSVTDVHVVCVHPSPELFDFWQSHMDETRFEFADGIPMREESLPLPARVADSAPADVSSMVGMWLRGSYELQALLHAAGHRVTQLEADPAPNMSTTLLSRLHDAVRAPTRAARETLETPDGSVQIHRAHNLARQIEVLHDAILHAFGELPGLNPHDVLVLCADIEAAAPLLHAVFDREVVDDRGTAVTLPLVVADRSLRDVSLGADLLSSIVQLVGSRYRFADVAHVVSHPLVVRRVQMGQEDLRTWWKICDETRLRWGIDSAHRASQGLDAPSITAHTWTDALERALLGALSADASLASHGGSIAGLEGLDVVDADSLSALLAILTSLARLEDSAQSLRPISFWCDEVEQVLLELCGDASSDLDDALDVLSEFRRAVRVPTAKGELTIDETVRFEEFADLLVQRLSTTPGRQPLRTGAITATSFVPLRSVPFRVVCIVGLDDGTLPNAEAESDDLVARIALMGDPDPRADVRRVVLDAVMAAQDRLIITSNGRSIKNNTVVPLVTPLAELHDLCGALGVDVPDDAATPSLLEVVHPRHLSNARNFLNGQVRPDAPTPWSHSQASRRAAERVGVSAEQSHVLVAQRMPAVPTLSLHSLEQMVVDPLRYYLREALNLYVDRRTGRVDTTLPVAMSTSQQARASQMLFEHWRTHGATSPTHVDDALVSTWWHVMQDSDLFPVGPFAEGARSDVVALVNDMVTLAAEYDVPLRKETSKETSKEFALTMGSTTLDVVVPQVVMSSNDPSQSFIWNLRFDHYGDSEVVVAGIRLLALVAHGIEVRKALCLRRDGQNLSNVVDILAVPEAITRDDALSRLQKLVDVEPLVRGTPVSYFDETAQHYVEDDWDAPSDTTLEEFEKRVDNRYFSRSDEALVFGAAPQFSDVFMDVDARVHGIMRSLFGARTLHRKKKDRGTRFIEWTMQ